MSDRLDQIEVRMSFLEKANGELSDMVYRQQQELKSLRAHLESLLQRIEAEQASATSWTAQDEKPPHY
jgi:SlyX protein